MNEYDILFSGLKILKIHISVVGGILAGTDNRGPVSREALLRAPANR